MSALLYYLLIRPLSRLPLVVLYRLSEVAYVLLYYVVGYRTEVVFANLRRAYPERSEAEIKRIAKRFYRHFCDLMVESARMLSMSEAEGKRRYRLVNPEVLEPYYESGRHVLAVTGHYANWELAAVGLPGQMQYRFAALYSPLKNDFFDRKIRKLRGRYGLELVNRRHVARFFKNMAGRPPTLTLFLGDQSPSSPELQQHWTTFLRQETGVLMGVERYAVLFNQPVVYLRIRRVKRGYYEVMIIPIEDQPTLAAPYSITERHTRLLEAEIEHEPAFWLWTHRRWKHKRVGESRVTSHES